MQLTDRLRPRPAYWAQAEITPGPTGVATKGHYKVDFLHQQFVQFHLQLRVKCFSPLFTSETGVVALSPGERRPNKTPLTPTRTGFFFRAKGRKLRRGNGQNALISCSSGRELVWKTNISVWKVSCQYWNNELNYWLGIWNQTAFPALVVIITNQCSGI